MNKNPWTARLVALALVAAGWTLVTWTLTSFGVAAHQAHINISTTGDTASIVDAVKALGRTDVQIHAYAKGPRFNGGVVGEFFAFFFCIGFFVLSYRIARDYVDRFL